jgi:predicted translin family RNA/ssDNA-binding protein
MFQGEARETLEPSSGDIVKVPVPPTEYLLGIADVTGELMRLAVHNVGQGVNDTRAPNNICQFLRELSSALQPFSLTGREMQHKLTTMRQSVSKVEAACYMLHIRGSELPQNLLVDALSPERICGMSDMPSLPDNFD